MDKNIAWPAVKAEDDKGLQAYSLFLCECCNAMEDLRYLGELNMPANMKTIIQKLPYQLRAKWRHMKFMKVADLALRIFISSSSTNSIISDPIFGDIQDTQVVNKGGVKTKVQQKSQLQ